MIPRENSTAMITGHCMLIFLYRMRYMVYFSISFCCWEFEGVETNARPKPRIPNFR